MVSISIYIEKCDIIHCEAIQCNISIFGKGSLLRTAWVANIANEWLPYRNILWEMHLAIAKVSIKTPHILSLNFYPFCVHV